MFCPNQTYIAKILVIIETGNAFNNIFINANISPSVTECLSLYI